VFELRPGARFHDGRTLDSADVVATFARLREHPELEIALYTNEVVSARALSPSLVELRTRQPLPALLNKLSLVYVVPRDAGPGLAQRPCGTGPYRLEGRPAPQELDLVATGDRPLAAALDRVRLRLGRSADDAWHDLRDGHSDFAQLSSRAAEREMGGRPDVSVLRHTGVFLKFLGFDLARPRTPYVTGRNPFLDPRVRQAISLAIDRERLVAGLSVPAIPASQLVPPVIFGFSPELKAPAPDPVRARALLAAAGFPRGFAVTLHARELAGGEAAEPVRAMLAEVGIRVDVVQLREPEFRAVSQEPPSLFLTRYACDTGEASDALNAVIHSRDAARGYGYGNFGRYAQPALDALIEQSSQIEVPEERLQAFQDILRQVAEQDVIVPLYYDENVFGLRKGFTWQPRADGYVLAAEIAPVP
jgi:peptide/nickel transport system substrate-binding protein